jgi:hypothetical protein
MYWQSDWFSYSGSALELVNCIFLTGLQLSTRWLCAWSLRRITCRKYVFPIRNVAEDMSLCLVSLGGVIFLQNQREKILLLNEVPYTAITSQDRKRKGCWCDSQEDTCLWVENSVGNTALFCRYDIYVSQCIRMFLSEYFWFNTLVWLQETG